MMLSNKEILVNKNQGKVYLPKYLTELNALFKCAVSINNLLSLQDSENLKDNSIIAMKGCVPIKKIVPFDDKKTLEVYIKKLVHSYNKEIYVFTDYSKYCGVASVSKLECFNTSFKYEDEHAGIVSMLTKELGNNLVLDFFEDEDGIRMLELEVTGQLWSSLITST